MRYQVPVIVTLTAVSEADAQSLVRRLVEEAPDAHRVHTDGFRFTVGNAAQVAVLRSDRVLSLSDDELQHVTEALAEYREDNG